MNAEVTGGLGKSNFTGTLGWEARLRVQEYEVFFPLKRKFMSELDQASRCNYQFTGKTVDRGTYYMKPQGCNQQNPDCAKSHGQRLGFFNKPTA